ncbi:hypothetical protein K9M06_04445 [Candidatus Bipolaricaulota bacterium]|nr:hypothetical protein [Candidatus Bipolaricaulota bacterium]
MQDQVKQNCQLVNEKSGEPEFARNSSCPRCGGDIVPTTRQVTATFPAPALERFVCSEADCNYVRYSKLNDNGAENEAGFGKMKGETGAK